MTLIGHNHSSHLMEWHNLGITHLAMLYVPQKLQQNQLPIDFIIYFPQILWKYLTDDAETKAINAKIMEILELSTLQK